VRFQLSKIFKNNTSISFLVGCTIFLVSCGSPEKSQKPTPLGNTSRLESPTKGKNNYFPAGETEIILDENGNEVSITDDDFEYFKKPSKDTTEMFRVLITGKKYNLRQIRSSALFKRKSDPGGDALIIEDVARYDGKINFLDDGMVVVNLNAKSGKIEKVNFGTRTTRIGDLSKIIQNDSTRWQLEHKTPEPTVTKYTVIYYIQLQGNASKDEIKEQLKKEVRK
jgi:hypothetical protein